MIRRFSWVGAFVVLALVPFAQAQTPDQLLPPVDPSATPPAAATPPALPPAHNDAPAAPPALSASTQPLDSAGLPLVAESSLSTPTSMGSSKTTLLFTPNQINALRAALIAVEGRHTTGTTDMAIVMPEEKQKVVEPEAYPVFYLSSIVYHTPTDWSIWVSGRKITSQKNPTTLRVLSVSPERAVFAWTPAYADALTQRVHNHLFAPTDAVKNKLTSAPTFNYDEKNGRVVFSLLTNQSFTAAYFATFEGFVPSPKLESLDKSPTPGSGAAGAASAPAAGNAQGAASSADSFAGEKMVHTPNEGLADGSINALLTHIKQ